MKKRLFLFVAMIATIACLFAICASAADVVVDGVHYTTYSSNNYEGYNGTATVSKGNRTATTQIVVIPDFITLENGDKYVVTSISNDAFYDNTAITELRILSKYITAIPAAMIANTTTLQKIYIDFSNITSIGSAGLNPSNQTNGNGPRANTFYYYDAKAFIANGTDVKITCPDFSNCTSIGNAAFQGANFEKVVIPASVAVGNQMFRMSTITELVIEGENRESMGIYNFNACNSLTKITILSKKLKSIGNDNFSGCTAVTEIHMDCSKLETVGGVAFCFSTKYDGGNTTTQWYNLDGDKIVDLSSLKNPSDQAFASSNIGSATIIGPTALVSLPNQTFRKCNIKSLYLGTAEGKTMTAQYWAFEGNQFETIIFGKGITQIDARFTASCKVVCLADSVSLTDSTVFSQSGSELYCKDYTATASLSNATIYTLTGASDIVNNRCGVGITVTTADETKRIEKIKHTEGSTEVVDATCTTPEGTAHICKFCATTISIDETAPALGHSCTVLVDIVYARYDADGYKVHKCVRCDETDSSAVANAIFEHKGYSYKLDGSAGISSEFDIDLDALNEYESLKSTIITFGVVIVSPKYLPSGTTEYFFDGEKVNADNGVVQVELQADQRKYSRLTCYVKGFDRANANHNALELIIAGYAYEDANSIQFMQKQYVADELSPCVSKVTKQDALLYTVTIGTVETKVAYDESKIKEFGVAE